MTAQGRFSLMARALAEALHARRVKHMLVGGLAVAVHGRPRFTKDIDLVVALATSEVVPFLRELRARGFTLAEEDLASHLLSPGQVGRAFFGDEAAAERLHVDLMIVLPGYEEQALGRATTHTILGTARSVATAEDLLLSKVVSGRPIDLSDADAIVLRKGPDLDGAYLRRWAGDLGVALGRPDLSSRLEETLRKVRSSG